MIIILRFSGTIITTNTDVYASTQVIMDRIVFMCCVKTKGLSLLHILLPLSGGCVYPLCVPSEMFSSNLEFCKGLKYFNCMPLDDGQNEIFTETKIKT